MPTTTSAWRHVAFTTERFAEDLPHLSPKLKRATVNKFVAFAREFAANPTRALSRHDSVGYLSKEVKEVDVTSDWRAVIEPSAGRCVLYAVGDHDLIERRRYTRAHLDRDRAAARVPFADVVSRSLFETSRRDQGSVLEEALMPSWYYHLDKQQSDALDTVFAALSATEDPGAPGARFVITGGPGTGKTTILVHIAEQLDWDPRRVGIRLSKKVADQIALAGTADVSACRCSDQRLLSRPVGLVDDPDSWEQLLSHLGSETKLAVIAGDLAQIQGVVPDGEFAKTLRRLGATHIHLTRCYRQAKNVGRTALPFLRHISERFTKHIRRENVRKFAKTHTLSVESANDMTFSRAGGYSEVYPLATHADVRQEIARIGSAPLWRHSSPVCVVFDESLNPRAYVSNSQLRVPIEYVPLAEAVGIKGVEYQHVFVLLSQDKFLELTVTGERGLSTDEYVAARNLRIPFSRATDSLVIFGLADE